MAGRVRVIPGLGIYSYGNAQHQFAREDVADRLLLVGERMEAWGREFGLGEISVEVGVTPGHGTHQHGTDVDMRPIRLDREREPCNIWSDEYDRVGTILLCTALKDVDADPIFSDPVLIAIGACRTMKAERYRASHQDHIHCLFGP